jgi:uncharacterized protein (DUF1501 family)
MEHDHDHGCGSPACGHDELPLDRFGARIQDGAAHAHDHREWSRRDFMFRMGFASVGTMFMFGRHPVTAFGGTPLLHALRNSGTDRVLILIQLNGGNDGLNTVIPVNNDIYYQNRPQIGISKQQAILLDDETGIHPAMSALQPIWDNGQMAVVHNVGYSSQTRSHFEGTVNWATARDQGEPESTGWLGRYLIEGNPDIFSNPTPYPLAVRVGGPATIFQSTAGNLSVTFGDAQEFEQFVLRGGYYDPNDVPATPWGAELGYVRNVTNASFRYVESVQTASNAGSNLADNYPGSGLGSSLAVIARMLRGGLQTRMFTVSRGGFDTHSGQGGAQGSHANLLGDVASSVGAFLEDLALDGLDDRVAIMTFSEFGRTLSQNGSGGTDHGAAAPMLLFGKGIAGGLYGTQSNLVDLYGGDPRFTTDYRSVYADVLNDWFGLQAPTVDDILGGSYARMGLIGSPIQVGVAPRDTTGSFTISQNYPNPFSASTTIAYSVETSGPVRLEVFDINGRRVKTLVDRQQSSGAYEVQMDGDRLPSGIYHYRLSTNGGTNTRQMTLVK